MQANPKFRHQDKKFWANVRTIGQELGYTKFQQVRIYTLDDLKLAMTQAGLGTNHLIDSYGSATQLTLDLLEYFTYRANILNHYV